ncbi:MAG: PDZ domain-containing protein [Acidimicrobiia bacterium]
MSDETPENPETPESPDAAPTEAPTEPVAATAATADTGPVDRPAPGTDRPGVFVPRWLAILLGIVVAVGLVGGGGFWLGRETADDDGPRSEETARPFEPRQGPSTPNTPDFPDIPDLPQAPQGRQLLGIAVEDADDGATVVRVTSGSPADDAGLEVGDVITEIDGEAVSGAADVVAAVRSNDAGDEITITYERDGEAETVRVTLADLSSDGGSAS